MRRTAPLLLLAACSERPAVPSAAPPPPPGLVHLEDRLDGAVVDVPEARVVAPGQTLLTAEVGFEDGWQTRSVDLAALTGPFDLALEADGDGDVALWAAPFLSGTPAAERAPNVVFFAELWAANQALATRFGEAEAIELSPEQLEALEALGYVR